MTDPKLELPSDDILVDVYLRDPHTGRFPPGKIADHLCLRAVARLAQDSARKQIAAWLRGISLHNVAAVLDPPAPAEKKLDEATLDHVCDWMRRSMGEDHAKRFRSCFGLTKREPSV